MSEANVIMTGDHGLSRTKVIWNVPGGTANLLQIGPEIKQVKSETLLESGLGSGKPEDSALIELADGRLFTVGKYARDLRGRAPVEESKYQSAVYKTLAAVGVVATVLGVTKVNLTLSTLLPYSEYQDRQQFTSLLKEHLKEFKFRGTTIRCNAETVIVKPEGAGLAITYMNEAGEDVFYEQNTLVFMVGHRDASLLPFEEGSPNTGLGEELGDQLGFLEFQKQVVARAGLNVSPKHQARLPEYLFRARQEPRYVRLIAEMAVTGSEVDNKVDQLKDAIEVSQRWYVATLTEWVESTIGPFLRDVDHVILSGGAAFYLKDELTDFFRSFSGLEREAISWGGLESGSDIESVLGETISDEFAVRLADVYGLYINTIQKFPKLAPSIDAAEDEETKQESNGKVVDSEAHLDAETRTVAPAEAKAATNGKRRKSAELPALPKTSRARG